MLNQNQPKLKELSTKLNVMVATLSLYLELDINVWNAHFLTYAKLVKLKFNTNTIWLKWRKLKKLNKLNHSSSVDHQCQWDHTHSSLILHSICHLLHPCHSAQEWMNHQDSNLDSLLNALIHSWLHHLKDAHSWKSKTNKRRKINHVNAILD